MTYLTAMLLVISPDQKSKKELLMTDKERNALIPLPSGGLANIGSGPKSILSGMVSDALALARGASVAAARFRIGDYEFRDPDYRQILIWAKALGIEAEVFISRIKENFERYQQYLDEQEKNDTVDEDDVEETFTDSEPVYFEVGIEVKDGSIVSLVWDFDSFPISSFEWVDGLRIKRLCFQGSASAKISLRLSSLEVLECSSCSLTELDLSKVPALTVLDCRSNRITKLDLLNVPVLMVFNCGFNQITELDLSKVPALGVFICGLNRITKLDLSKVPALRVLNCSFNPITKLDLSKVPVLDLLKCGYNQLIELDLSAVPALTVLWYGNNQLVKLDLSAVPVLTTLGCNNNRLVELDLSNVPALTQLDCSNNQLIELDLSAVPALTELNCHNNKLVELDIRGLRLLKRLYCNPFVRIKKFPTQNPRIFRK